MIKILDPKEHAKAARLDENDNPVKVMADHFLLISYRMDTIPRPHVEATFARVTANGEEIGAYTQFHIEGAAYDYLMTPKPHETGRKPGHFRPEDIEECIVHFGDFPGAKFKDKIELVKG
jgi:hypothetical protein